MPAPDDLRDRFAIAACGAIMGTAENVGEADPEERARLWRVLAAIVWEASDAMVAFRPDAPAVTRDKEHDK